MTARVPRMCGLGDTVKFLVLAGFDGEWLDLNFTVPDLDFPVLLSLSLRILLCPNLPRLSAIVQTTPPGM
jgi:hypothetical protein